MKRIEGSIRKAIQDYQMIAENDIVAVGISGGKDSLVLYNALLSLRAYYPVAFDVVPIYVDMGLAPLDTAKTAEMYAFFEKTGHPLNVVNTQIGALLFDVRNGDDACSLCSKMRRGALCNKAASLGCTKVALGHHADDVLETFMLSWFYEGRLSTFEPITQLDKNPLSIIRPMIYIKEGELASAAKRLELPVCKNPCPADHHTAREEMKKYVKAVCADIPFAKDNMLGAIQNPERNHLWQKPGK